MLYTNYVGAHCQELELTVNGSKNIGYDVVPIFDICKMHSQHDPRSPCKTKKCIDKGKVAHKGP